MRRKHLAAFLVLMAAGCSQSPAPDAGSAGGTADQQAVTPSDPNLTLVTFNVPGMT